MLDRIADAFGRQELDIEIDGQPLAHQRRDAIRNDGVGLEGQVQAVLLVRAERQDGDPVAGRSGSAPAARSWTKSYTVPLVVGAGAVVFAPVGSPLI